LKVRASGFRVEEHVIAVQVARASGAAGLDSFEVVLVMKVRLRFFASLRERVHMSECEREVPDDCTVGRVWREICAEHPGVERFGASISFAVNREYAAAGARLREGDEVAFIPPVSGG
jgi:molybdopterin converting factor subunit 1